MKIKRILSAITALAISVSAFAGFAINANADAVVLPKTIDFSEDNSLTASSKGSHTTFSAGAASTAGATAMTDDANGRVLKLGSSGSGSTRYLGYTADLGEITDGAVTLSYDLEPHQVASSGNSNVIVQFADSNLTPVFYVTSGTRSSSFLNINNSNQETTAFKTIYKITADMNFYNQTVNVKITSADGATEITSYSGSMEATDLRYLYYPNTNWKYGYVFLDNITIAQTAGSATTFTVTDTSGAALADATVKVGAKSFTTDANGQVVLTLPDGDYSYEVEKMGTTATDSSTGTVTVAGTEQTVNAQLNALSYTPVITSVSMTGDDYTGYAELGGELTYTATVLDQASTEVSGENVVWSVSPADSGLTVEDGVVTIATTATAGTYTVKAASETNADIYATKTVEVKRVRDITYSGLDIITPFGGSVSTDGDAAVTKEQNAGETIVYEFDIYVPKGSGNSAFIYKNGGNVGAEYRFYAAEDSDWVIVQYVTGGGGAYNINSSEPYSKFKADHFVHAKIETAVIDGGLGNSIFTVRAVDGDTSAFDQSGSVRYPTNDRDGGRTIAARNLATRELNKITYYGTATVVNAAMYTKAANVTIDAPNATVTGIEAGYIAQNTYAATVTPDEGYAVRGVTVDGEAVTANDDGTYSVVVDGDTAVAVTTEVITVAFAEEVQFDANATETTGTLRFKSAIAEKDFTVQSYGFKFVNFADDNDAISNYPTYTGDVTGTVTQDFDGDIAVNDVFYHDITDIPEAVEGVAVTGVGFYAVPYVYGVDGQFYYGTPFTFEGTFDWATDIITETK